jgi:hypothetical protein
MTKKVDVQETTEYESCLDYESDEFIDVTRFMDEELETPILAPTEEDKFLTRDQLWKKYWKGMPSYDQNDNPPWKQLYLNFRNEEDYNEFAKLIGQALTKDTKSIWFPKLEIEENSLHRWIVE